MIWRPHESTASPQRSGWVYEGIEETMEHHDYDSTYALGRGDILPLFSRIITCTFVLSIYFGILTLSKQLLSQLHCMQIVRDRHPTWPSSLGSAWTEAHLKKPQEGLLYQVLPGAVFDVEFFQAPVPARKESPRTFPPFIFKLLFPPCTRLIPIVTR